MRKHSSIQLLATLTLFLSLGAATALRAQTASATPAESFMVTIRYLKVEPGMSDEFKKTMDVWKKLLQARKDKGEIRYWRLFKRSFPMGAGSAYDYIAISAFNDPATIETFDGYSLSDWAKGLPKEEAALIENSNKVRTLVDRSVLRFNSAIADGKPGKYLQIISNELKPGRRMDYLKALEKTGTVAAEAMKAGKITNRSTWERVAPNSADLGDFVVVFDFATLADALVRLDFSDQHRKLYPEDDQDAFWAGMREIRQTLSTEIWERIDGTK